MIVLFNWIFLFSGCKDEPADKPEVRLYQTPLSTLETRLQRGFADGLPNMLDVSEEYQTMMEVWADTSCPHFNEPSNGIDGQWVDDCTSSNGVHFLGFSNFSGVTVSDDPGHAGSLFSSIWGSFDAIHEDGASRTVGGLGQIAVMPVDGGFDMNLKGSFWLQPSRLWMQEGSDSFEVRGSIFDKLTFHGGVQYPGVTVYFDETQFDFNQCGGTAVGTLKIRDATGYWFILQKQACRDCDVVQWEGYNVGEICIGNSLDQALHELIESAESYMNE